jgi:predicted GNAT family acetyltransferase
MERGLLDLLRRIEADTADGAGRGMIVRRVGPFVAIVHPTNDFVWLSAVVMDSRADVRALAPTMIDELRSLFREHQRILRFEIFEPLWPGVAGMLESCGVAVQGRMPLMVCAPGDLRPFAAAGVEIRPVTASATDQEIEEFLATARRCFGEARPVGPADVAEARGNLSIGRYRWAAAWVDGTLAGVGSMTVSNNELVGIGTVAEFRGRGIATMVSSHLVAEHFARGADVAWLSAGESAAEAAYRKIGFRGAGVQVNYLDRMT